MIVCVISSAVYVFSVLIVSCLTNLFLTNLCLGCLCLTHLCLGCLCMPDQLLWESRGENIWLTMISPALWTQSSSWAPCLTWSWCSWSWPSRGQTPGTVRWSAQWAAWCQRSVWWWGARCRSPATWPALCRGTRWGWCSGSGVTRWLQSTVLTAEVTIA